MHIFKYLAIVMLLASCHTRQTSTTPKVSVSDKAKELSAKYILTQTDFDAECINKKGDLTKVVSGILANLLPEEQFTITEEISPDQKKYIATVKHSKGASIKLYADTWADYLPDGFTFLLDSIPAKIGSNKSFAIINPRLTGQGVWYFCGTEANLLSARKEGLPLVLTGEEFMETDLSDFE